MKLLIQFLFEKSTLFSIIAIVCIVCLTPSGVLGLGGTGHGEAMAAGIVLAGVLVLLAILVVDRILVRFIGQAVLNAIEVLLLVILACYIYFTEGYLF